MDLGDMRMEESEDFGEEEGADIEGGVYEDDEMMSLLVPSVGDGLDEEQDEEPPEGPERRPTDLVRPKSYPQKQRVHMIHLRAYLDKVGQRVESKQVMVNKLREQLATCRAKLEDLDREEADTKALIVEENEAGRTAAVFRLRAQLNRVLLEQQGEGGLRQHLEECLEDAQYELTLAQIEQGKYLVAEAQLAGKEEEYEKHQQELAAYRQRKEHHFAMMTRRNLHRKDEMRAEAREMMEAQERMNKEKIKEAHERHNRFLKETMEQIRRENAREENEYREDLEKKIKSVLTLKQDITKNRENLAALQAKNRAMELSAKRRDEQLRMSVASDGGNSDLALRRQRRLQEHAVKKEVFKTTQRQKEVEIAAKIIMEEERMLKRRAQMPYLFETPQSSKALSFAISRPKEVEDKRVKPHRRRKLQITKDAERKVDHFDMDDEVEASHVMAEGRGYSDLDSPLEDDDNDDTQTASIDKYAERLVKQEQDQPSDTLAQPEFEGLWDKHKAYTVPTDTQAGSETGAKAGGPSKMDQEIMDRVLERTRANIVTKQVAAGREFSGQPFYSKPGVIHFKDFEVGKTYRKRVILTNVSYTVNYCKLVGITELLKDFIELSFDPPGQLSAGMTCDLHVTFSPKINEDLIGEVHFLAQTGPFSIPLKCTTKKCDLSVDRTLVDFGTTVIGEKLKRSFILRNKGAKGTTFEFVKLSPNRFGAGLASTTPTATVEEAEVEEEAPKENSEDSERPSEEVEEEEGEGTGRGDELAEAEEATVTESARDEGLPETEERREAEPEIASFVEEEEEDEDEEDDDLAYGVQPVGPLTGEIGPFSEVRLELSWAPEVPDDLVRSEFLLRIADPESEDIEVAAIGVAVDVPVWVERQSVDLRVCMFDRLYQDTVVVNNRASTALRLKFEVCPALRSYMELLPKTGYIQAHSQFSAQLKFMPRAGLVNEVGPELFDPATGLLEVPMTIRVADQTRPVEFTVQAVVTPTDLEFDVSSVDFGRCTIHESVVSSIRLTNTSILPQKFGFVKLPDFLEVQPNDGFGTLLPKETLELDVIFSPPKAKEYKFEIVCKSLIGRTFSIPCFGVGVHPPLELSDQVVHFRSTALSDVNTAHLYVINSHTSMNQYAHPVPRIGSGEIAPVGPTSFEFVVPPGAPISIAPCVGTVLPGKRCRVEIRFRPRLGDETVREEACRLIRMRKEAEAEAEYERRLEEERLAAEEAEKNAAKGGKKGPPPKGNAKEEKPPTAAAGAKKGKASSPSKGTGRKEDEGAADGPRPVTVPPPESLDPAGDDYAAGVTSLTRQYAGDFATYQIPCFVASGACAIDSTPNAGLPYSPANTLYLEVHCPTVRPELAVISNHGRHETPFGDVSVGKNVTRSVTLQNISDRRLQLSSSVLDPEGPFLLLNALRPLEPGASHTLIISFTPGAQHVYHEVLALNTGRSRLSLVFRGRGVQPSVRLDVENGGELDLGAVIAGEYIERPFTIENISALDIDFAVRLESVSLRRFQGAQKIPAFVKRHRKEMEEGFSSVTGSALVGLQNQAGHAVFDCVPSAGTIAPGQKIEVVVTFAPDHAGQFQDAVRIVLFDQDQTHLFRLRGEAWPHIMFVSGGDRLWPDADSLSVLPPAPDDEELAEPGGKGPGAPVGSLLLTFGAKMDEEGNIEPATRHIFVGCVRTMAVSQKKNGEFSIDNPQVLNQKGFTFEPPKGQVEAGMKKPVRFTWAPPPGHDPNVPVDCSILVTVRGDVTEQFKVILRALVVSDDGVVINEEPLDE